MGQNDILEFSGEQRRNFMRALLYDLRALELMLDGGLFEEGIRRIGAEQELFLVDRACHPANASLAMLVRSIETLYVELRHTNDAGLMALMWDRDADEETILAGHMLLAVSDMRRSLRRYRTQVAIPLGSLDEGRCPSTCAATARATADPF